MFTYSSCSSFNQIWLNFKFPVLSETSFPRWNIVWKIPILSTEKIRKNAGNSQVCVHFVAIFLGSTRVNTVDVMSPQNPSVIETGAISKEGKLRIGSRIVIDFLSYIFSWKITFHKCQIEIYNLRVSQKTATIEII